MSLETVASTLIAENGRAFTYRQTTGATYNTVTRTYSGGSTATAAIVGFAEPYTRYDGQFVQLGDQKLWVGPDALAAASIEPAEGDFIEEGSTRYRVVSIDHWHVGSTLAAYVFQIRGIE